MKERCDREMAAALLLVLFRGNKGVGNSNPKQLNNQQRGQHRRLGKSARRARRPGGSELPASGKRTVGSLGRLHHAAQSVWTHNVRPARKTGCRGWG